MSVVTEGIDDLSREQLDTIKARTLYNMVEPLGDKSLLFLTNAQASLLSSNSESLRKMLDVLDVREPQLVINLLVRDGLELPSHLC